MQSKNIPLNLEVPPSAVTYSSIAVIWDKPKNRENITGYRVYINGTFTAQNAENETFYTADGLSPDTEYTISVSAVKSETESEAVTISAKTAPSGTVRDVTKPPYNAAGDGVTLDTTPIQSAIDDCNDNDIVLIPAGYTFLTGALDLKSNMTLEVNGTLLSSTNAADFERAYGESKKYIGGKCEGAAYTEEAPKRLVWSRMEGWEMYCYRSLINIGSLDRETDYGKYSGYSCENVKICGTGTITGGSAVADCPPIKGDTTLLAINEMANTGVFYDFENSATSVDFLKSRIRGRLITVANGKNIYIKGITAANSPCWTLHMIYSNGVTTNGVTFNTSAIRNGDGWDPDSSENCTLFGCTFNTGDDCVAIKSGKNPEGNIINRPTKNIRIIGCKSRGGLGLAIGSEMSGGVDGVYVRDCVMSNTRYGIELKASRERGGYIRDAHFEDCTVDRVLIHSVDYNADGGAAEELPVFSDISFENVNILGYCGYTDEWLDTTVQTEGFADGDCVKNISFKNITVGTERNIKQTISMEHCRDMTFENVQQSNGKEPTYSASNAKYSKKTY
ncbi:MAG: glycoside hydrolase family 28 protein [Oscillospiraceae bacterium]|nr:glycoside hydrolase family 28 protein [Oscillospiraceae bacterium]